MIRINSSRSFYCRTVFDSDSAGEVYKKQYIIGGRATCTIRCFKHGMHAILTDNLDPHDVGIGRDIVMKNLRVGATSCYTLSDNCSLLEELKEDKNSCIRAFLSTNNERYKNNQSYFSNINLQPPTDPTGVELYRTRYYGISMDLVMRITDHTSEAIISAPIPVVTLKSGFIQRAASNCTCFNSSTQLRRGNGRDCKCIRLHPLIFEGITKFCPKSASEIEYIVNRLFGNFQLTTVYMELSFPDWIKPENFQHVISFFAFSIRASVTSNSYITSSFWRFQSRNDSGHHLNTSIHLLEKMKWINMN